MGRAGGGALAEGKKGLLFIAVNTERSRGLCRHRANQMCEVPHSAPWDDLQSSRSLGRASVLCSLISDGTPRLSSSSPILHVQEQRQREHTGRQRAPLIWGAPDRAVHHACAQDHCCRATSAVPVPSPTSLQDKSILQRAPQENPVPVACRECVQDRQGPRRSDFRKCANAQKHTSINVCGWSPRRRKMRKWGKSHI